MDESSLNIVVDGDSSGAVRAFDSLDRSIVAQEASIASWGGAMQNAFSGITPAANEVTGSMKGVKTIAADPFEHAGLFLFSRQVLGLAGLSDVARHAMGAITLGFEEVAGAAGLTVAAIAPYLLVLGLGIVAVEKWAKGHKDAATATEDLLTKEMGAIKVKEDLVEKIDAYKKAVGELTPELKNLRQATLDQTAADRAQAEATAQSLVTSLAAQLAANEKAQAAAQAAITINRELNQTYQNGAEEHVVNTAAIDTETQRLAALTAAHLTLHSKSAQAEADLKALKDGFASANDEMDKQFKLGIAQQEQLLKAQEAWVKMEEAADKALDKIVSEWGNLVDEEINLTDKDQAITAAAWDKKSMSAKTSLDTTLAAIEKHYRAASELAKKYGDDGVGLVEQYEATKASAHKLYEDRASADTRAFFGLQATMMQGFETTGVNTFNQLANGVSTSFAKMVVEGKNMQQNLDQVFKNVAESFIAAVGEMMIKWMAFKAVTGILGAASMGAGAGVEPMFPGMAGGGGVLTVPGYAAGGSFDVDRTTLIAVGEGGQREHVQITPAAVAGSGAGGGSGGGDTYVAITVPGAGDPSAVAQRVVDYLMQQTKGRGQVNPIGASIYGR